MLGPIRTLATVLALTVCSTLRSGAANDLQGQIEAIRAKYNLPALGGAIFTAGGLKEMAVTGVRKRGDATPATKSDLWHLGSDTKVMTATLAGTFVAEKKLAWSDKVVRFFPEIAGQVPPAMRDVTVADVLRHKAGLVENVNAGPLARLWNQAYRNGALNEQRLAASREALLKPAYAPGTFHYSNTDYVVVAAILERISGKPWEELMRERIFKPLGMHSAGFGGLGTPGKIDQPWPHQVSGVPMPNNGRTVDNPPFMAPAGEVHCTMADWSKFLADQLRGGAGLKALLPADIYQAIQSDPAYKGKGEGYGFGWGICNRGWAGGKTLTHAGSNTMNYCICWLAPLKKFGVLVVTNQGGDTAAKAADEVASLLVQRYQAGTKP